MNSMANASVAEIKQDGLLEEFRNHVLALTVYTGLLGVAGIIGNLFVLYVHLFKYKECNFRSFVLALCAVDIFDCVAIIPMEMYSQLHFYEYGLNLICKAEAYLNVSSSCAMTYILLFIAIDRQRKICVPHGWQLSRKCVQGVCAGIFITAALYGIPIAILWGVNEAEVVYKNSIVRVHCCGKDESMKNTIWPKVYIFMLIPNFVLMSVMVGLYILIFCRLSRNSFRKPRDPAREKSSSKRFEKVKRSVSSLSGKIKTGVQNIRHSASNETVKNSYYNPTNRLEQCKSQTSWYTETGLDLEDIGMNGMTLDPDRISVRTLSQDRLSVDRLNGSCNRLAKQLLKRKRTTILTFTFTVSFICTGILYMALGSMIADHSDLIRSVTMWKDVLFLFGYRIFFINYILHPILYGFMDPYFRKSLRNLPMDVKSSFRRRPKSTAC